MRGSIAVALVGALLVANAPTLAQQQAAPNIQPMPIIEGQSATPVAPPVGIDQAGFATPTSGAVLPAAGGPLPPGPPAGNERAAAFSDSAALITGGILITGVVACVLACLSHSTSSTTSTVATHH